MASNLSFPEKLALLIRLVRIWRMGRRSHDFHRAAPKLWVHADDVPLISGGRNVPSQLPN